MDSPHGSGGRKMTTQSYNNRGNDDVHRQAADGSDRGVEQGRAGVRPDAGLQVARTQRDVDGARAGVGEGEARGALSAKTSSEETSATGYGFAYARWTRANWPGEWEWVNAYFRAQRFARFAELQS